MKFKVYSSLMVVCLIAVVIFSWNKKPPLIKESLAVPTSKLDVRVSQAAAGETALGSFEQLYDALDETRGQERATLLKRWLVRDRDGVFRFLKQRQYRDLASPAVARVVAKSFTARDLVDLANGMDEPNDFLLVAGSELSPKTLVEFSKLLQAVTGLQKKQIAGKVAALLESINLDASVDFAKTAPNGTIQAQAYAGIFDELKASSNGEVEIKSIYTSLPPTIKDSDPVRFAHGLAT
jgi:hypothetical protein